MGAEYGDAAVADAAAAGDMELLDPAAKEEAKSNKEKPKMVPVSKLLFKFATGSDMLLMAGGTLGALVMGCSMPAFIYLFGESVDGLNGTSILDTVGELAIILAVVGVLGMLAGGFQVALWSRAGESQALCMKEAYVRAILRQDMAWFDAHPGGELPTAVTQAMAKVQDGIGRKVADIIMNVTSFVAVFIVAFLLNAELAAVMIAVIPFVGGSLGIVTILQSKTGNAEGSAYSKAGAVANEVLGSVRTVASLNAEDNEISRYSSHLDGAEKAGITTGIFKGLGNGMMFFSFFCGYALAFWYGTDQVADDLESDCDECATGGKVIAAIFGILIGAMNLGQMVPGVTALTVARVAAWDVFETMDRVPPIDSADDSGGKLEGVQGELEFDKVQFSYPQRPDDVVYESVSLKVERGETLALVGPSGGGKSTMTKLILRFYDPTGGRLLLDGRDVRDLSVNWYRHQIGYVGQEPVLFAGSIAENIRAAWPEATDADVVKACKAANADKFISGFPDGYATDVGSGGLQLSGGQKQRVAIARAIIKDPAILLLDEATSALDSESEKVVQDALDKLRALNTCTTIVIAHRLSTIQDADRIAVVADKGIAEIGQHEELIAAGGIYANLCAMQAGDDGGADEDAGEDSARFDRQASHSRSKSRSCSDTQLARRKSGSTSVVAFANGNGEDGKGDKAEAEEEKLPPPPAGRLWAMNKPEAPYIALGLLGALVAGMLFPVEGVLIANIMNAMYLGDPSEIRDTGASWALGFVVLAGMAVLGHLCLSYGFSVSGERLTHRVRDETFKAMLRHDISWFDREENAVGVLTTRLEADATKMQSALGHQLGFLVQLITTLLTGLIIALISAWQVGLAAVGLMPIMGLAGFVQMAMMTGNYGDSEGLDGGVRAGVLLGGALNGMPTVTAFNMQKQIGEEYGKALQTTTAERVKRGFLSGLAFGYSQAAMFWVFAALFYIGAIWVDDGTLDFLSFFTAMFAIILGGFGAGQAGADVDNYGNAMQAAARLLRIQDDPFPIDPLSGEGAKPELGARSSAPEEKGEEAGAAVAGGRVSFEGLKFTYPQRPDTQVYGSDAFPQGFSLEVGPGEMVALVGPSGAGKSTCIQLLLRFYDASEGSIKLDGRDIRELNVGWLRACMGYVGQEPVLFAGSVRDNILRGRPGATEEEVVAAAKAAFCHDFVSSFPDGYDTDVGEKSALLSGGQKQRIAIARAIVRDPLVLLLDEATSALDNESERQVQEALDNLRTLRRRTTLVVAHRLTTVRSADKIAVLSGGGVKELGTHEQLVAQKGGVYSGLWKTQTDKFASAKGQARPAVAP